MIVEEIKEDFQPIVFKVTLESKYEAHQLREVIRNSNVKPHSVLNSIVNIINSRLK